MGFATVGNEVATRDSDMNDFGPICLKSSAIFLVEVRFRALGMRNVGFNQDEIVDHVIEFLEAEFEEIEFIEEAEAIIDLLLCG